MKSRLVLSITLLFFYHLTATGQISISDRGFAFQGYARNVDGSAVSSQSVQVRFSIFPNGGPNAFQETQTVDTDPFGIFAADIGTVNTNDFRALQFSNFDYFLRVEVSVAGSNFIEISNKQLKSVPYAQAAANGVPSGTVISFAGPVGNIPAGYVLCDGTSYDGNNPLFASLFAAIGTAWGGNGNNFNVPDLRGRFLRGQDLGTGRDEDVAIRVASNPGGAEGDNVGSFEIDGFSSHNHGFNGTTSVDGFHIHDVFKDDDIIESYNSDSGPGLGDGVIRDQIVTNGQQTQLNVINPSPGEFSLQGGGVDRINLGTGASAYSLSAEGGHSHTFSGTVVNSGGAENRPENVLVLYIIKL